MIFLGRQIALPYRNPLPISIPAYPSSQWGKAGDSVAYHRVDIEGQTATLSQSRLWEF